MEGVGGGKAATTYLSERHLAIEEREASTAAFLSSQQTG